jgi:hypothetical protein
MAFSASARWFAEPPIVPRSGGGSKAERGGSGYLFVLTGLAGLIAGWMGAFRINPLLFGVA